MSSILNPLNIQEDMGRYISSGDKEEAVYYLQFNLFGWIMNKKALEWLEDFSAKNNKNNKMKLIVPNKY
jgi:hypothetical protein